MSNDLIKQCAEKPTWAAQRIERMEASFKICVEKVWRLEAENTELKRHLMEHQRIGTERLARCCKLMRELETARTETVALCQQALEKTVADLTTFEAFGPYTREEAQGYYSALVEHLAERLPAAVERLKESDRE